MSAQLTISVVMPVKNGAARIERALDSVAAQDWPHELIVIDGASTDGTLDILNRRSREIARMSSGPDDSATIALNRGAELATGDVIAMLMSDDFLAEGALKSVAEAFAETPDTDVISGTALLVDERDNADSPAQEIPGASLTLHLDRILATPYPAAYFFRRGLWNALGGLSADYRYGGDRDLLMRCKLAKARHRSISAPVYHYSVNEGSDTLVDKPEVIKAFLHDHCLMANVWLRSSDLNDAERARIRSWRQEQVMELAVRNVQLGEWRAAGGLLATETIRNPEQFITSAKWLAAFGGKALGRKLRSGAKRTDSSR